MKKNINTDILIIGGGITGLWLLNRLLKNNYNAVLIESQTCGQGQTIASQGIIHGGLKYALQGIMSPAAKAMQSLPARWKDCLDGKGELDLSQTQINSPHQYLWSNGGLSNKISQFFASKALLSQCEKLNFDLYPDIFKNKKFNGQIYQLNEMVLNTQSLLQNLFNLAKDNIIYDNNCDLSKINYKYIIYTSGQSNQNLSNTPMQLRPLKMGILSNAPYPLYAHCMGNSKLPKITITTHEHNKKLIWYIGGQPAENGVVLTDDDFKDVLYKELKILLPWLDFSKTQLASFNINRAEGFTEKNKKPDLPVIIHNNNQTTIWPTKLAFAPIVSDLMLDYFKDKLNSTTIHTYPDYPKPGIAKYPWEELC